MKKLLVKFCFALALVLFFTSSSYAVTALWDHTETASAFKYKIAWGTTSGVYPNSQEMQRSACVPGTDPDGGAYDCKMIITGTFIDDATYYFVGYAINYDSSGKEQSSNPTPVFTFIKRPGGNVGPKPSPMQELGIYDK